VLAELIEWFRNALVILCGDEATRALDVTDEQLAELRAQVTGVERERVLRILETLIEADGRMRYALSRRVLLETTLFQCARAATTVTLNELLRELNRLKARWAQTGGAVTPGAAAPGTMRAASPSERGVSAPPVASGGGPKEGSGTMPAAGMVRSAAPAGGTPNIDAIWREAVENLGKLCPDLRAPLMRARLGPVENGVAIIRFDNDQADAARACQDPIARKAIRKELQRLLNLPEMDVRFEASGERTRTDSPSEGLSALAAQKKMPDSEPLSTPPPPPAPPSARGREDEVRRRILNDPAVKRVLETFEGTITDIRL